jgi:hypothetical protein
MAEGIGMLPTKIEAAELSQAFATGVAQSMISSGSCQADHDGTMCATGNNRALVVEVVLSGSLYLHV